LNEKAAGVHFTSFNYYSLHVVATENESSSSTTTPLFHWQQQQQQRVALSESAV